MVNLFFGVVKYKSITVQMVYQKMCFILSIAFFLVLFSCRVNYSFTGASIAPDVKTVSIAYFPNHAPLSQPILSQSFTEELRDLFNAQTNLNLIEKNGDLHLEGAITGYAVSIVGVQGGNNAQASLNRLTVTVNVKFTNKKDEKQNFDSSFSRFADFDASTQVLANVEVQLITEINKQLVQDVFNKSVTNW